MHDAHRGQHRGVTGPAVGRGAARRPRAFPGDDVHVLAVGAHVAGGDVAAAEGGDEPAVGAQQRFGLDLGGIADDDRLAAAVVQARQRVLIRHGDGEPQHVGQGLVLAAVRIEAGAAEGRAQRGGVDADDRLEAAAVVLAEGDLLVIGSSGRLVAGAAAGCREYVGHGGDPPHRQSRLLVEPGSGPSVLGASALVGREGPMRSVPTGNSQ